MPAKRALICGISGQDGSYLAELLIGKGYEVHGTSRSGPAGPRANVTALGIAGKTQVHQLSPTDREGAEAVLRRAQPDEIYYLAAQSSVWRSFELPLATFEASALGLIAMIESARKVVPRARLLNAASGDCFGRAPAETPATERSRFAPHSPYAAAKCAGHHAVSVARLAYGQFVCSAFLFTHESPLRPETFAFPKIAGAARRIAAGSGETLELGGIDVVRDWGWAPEYVDAMWRMLQLEEPEDFVIATGRSRRLGEFVELAFGELGLDWRDHVVFGPGNPRPADIDCQYADPSRAGDLLGWEAVAGLEEIAARLVRG